MIKDGRLKAHKFGREWRFIRKDIEGEEAYGIAARGKTGELDEKDAEIISKYL